MTADPFAVPGCGSKMVRVGMSLQLSPLACGAGPAHSRMVWMPRNALSVPGMAQGESCALAAETENKPTAKRANRRFTKTPVEIRQDYNGQRAPISET